jgi:hypothetical protein
MTDIPLPGQTSYAQEQGLHQIAEFVAMRKIGDLQLVAGALLFKDIPQTFKHLRLLVQGQSQRVSEDNMNMRFNGVATASYLWGANGRSGAGDSSLSSVGAVTEAWIGNTPGTDRSNDAFVSNHVVDIPFYSSANNLKSWLSNATIAASAISWGGWTIRGQNVGFATPVISLSVYAQGGILGPNSKASLYGIL